LLFHLGSTIARLKLKEIDGDTYKWWCMLFNSITRLILPILVSQPPPPSRRPHTHDRPPAPLVPPRRSRGGHVGVNGGGVARVGPAHSPPPHLWWGHVAYWVARLGGVGNTGVAWLFSVRVLRYLVHSFNERNP